MRLSGNTVLITGGSRGIGYAMAGAFLDAGSTVVICARGERRLIEAQHRHPNLHRRALARNPQPALINVSSGLGFVPMANMPVYCASKAGMHAFSMAMRVQLGKLGMKVFEIVPLMVDTALNPVGRAKRGGFKAGLGPQELVAAVMGGSRERRALDRLRHDCRVCPGIPRGARPALRGIECPFLRPWSSQAAGLRQRTARRRRSIRQNSQSAATQIRLHRRLSLGASSARTMLFRFLP